MAKIAKRPPRFVGPLRAMCQRMSHEGAVTGLEKSASGVVGRAFRHILVGHLGQPRKDTRYQSS